MLEAAFCLAVVFFFRKVTGCLLYQYFFSSLTLLKSVPTPPLTSTANSSPSLKYSFGSYPKPTPAGVPVKMMVPGSSVVLRERNEMHFGTEKIRSLIGQSWRTLPFFRPRMCNLAGSGIEEVETRAGPVECQFSIHGNLLLLASKEAWRIGGVRSQHTNWTTSIESLTESPLTLLKLGISVTKVIAGGVSEHVFQSICFRDVLAGFADNHAELGFIVATVICS